MPLRSLVRDVRDGFGSLSRRGFGSRRERSAAAADANDWLGGGDGELSRWACLPPELLREVVRRLEASESTWPARKHVVACAAVCSSWRLICKEMVSAPEKSAMLTFPISLKQPGPRTGPIQCYIKRNKASSTYHLFLGLNTENGKFLLSAKKIRRTRAEFIISLDAEDISRSSVNYMGKLRSNFLGTKFAIYDNQPPYGGAVTSMGRSSRRFYSRKVSPKVPNGSYGIAQVAYELNMLGTRGPRRMRCTMHSIPASALEPNGTVPSYSDLPRTLEESFSSISLSHSINNIAGDYELGGSSRFASSARFTEVSVDITGKGSPLILKNKAPRWHDQLQCWCLNFRGRVTVASVKNFQLIADQGDPVNISGSGSSQATGTSEHDKIILQFGKIGENLFSMDYRYPLSAFIAFGFALALH
eukprot:TRINITY_DN2941_c1_g1_i1.p1 TRINITY_DN2941_c1_g1~~TRINITY_DN2941_c1_g1_i1.p1  ORF type:complete len:417 (-),score=43.31 TRINITY_DN2941_c1_g1_i1:76-1326(-)